MLILFIECFSAFTKINKLQTSTCSKICMARAAFLSKELGKHPTLYFILSH